MKPSAARLATVLLVASSLVASGCASLLQPKRDPTRYYVLTPVSEMEARSAALPADPPLAELVLVLGPIKLPAYLDREQMVTRLAPNRVEVSDLNRWAEPLVAALPRVLAENLSALLGTKRITPYPSGAPGVDYEIQIDVVRFEAAADGSAVLTAHWSLKDGKTKQVLVARDALLARPAAEPSVAGSVAAESEALGELAAEIAGAIRQIQSRPGPAPRS